MTSRPAGISMETSTIFFQYLTSSSTESARLNRENQSMSGAAYMARRPTAFSRSSTTARLWM